MLMDVQLYAKLRAHHLEEAAQLIKHCDLKKASTHGTREEIVVHRALDEAAARLRLQAESIKALPGVLSEVQWNVYPSPDGNEDLAVADPPRRRTEYDHVEGGPN